MLSHRINTLAELQAEQDRLVGNMRIIRKEFARSAEQTTTKGRDFLLHSVLLPVGAIGLGAFVAKTLTNVSRPDENPYTQGQNEAEENGADGLSKLLLVALPLMRQFSASAKTAETAAAANGDERHNVQDHNRNGNGGWFTTVLLLAMPILEQYFLNKTRQESERSTQLEREDGSEVQEGTMAHRKTAASILFETLFKLLPVVLPLVQQYFAAENNKQADNSTGRTAAENGQAAAVAA